MTTPSVFEPSSHRQAARVFSPLGNAQFLSNSSQEDPLWKAAHSVQFPSSETIRKMGTSFRRNHFWDRLGGRTSFLTTGQCTVPLKLLARRSPLESSTFGPIPLFRNYKENGYTLSAQPFLGSFGWTSNSNDWSMVLKASINQSQG